MQKNNQHRFRDKFLRTKLWTNGYKAFNFLMNKPWGHLYLLEPEPEVFRLDRKKGCPLCYRTVDSHTSCIHFLRDSCVEIIKSAANDTPRFIRCPHGQQCCILPIFFKKKPYGFLTLCNLPLQQKHILQTISSFHYFVKALVENHFKEEEIEAIYENLHPRALAMSTIHTVHRIISSSLNIDDLLPRLTRFTFQVLKADYSAIYLLDEKKKYLVKRFETGRCHHKGVAEQKRIMVDTGVYGKIATVGNFYYSKRTIAVPLIEDDVIGIILAMCHRKNKLFSKVDLEILRTVSEQAVIAIKNAQLFEHHEKFINGSVESISNVIDLNVSDQDAKFADLFDALVFELGRELHLSALEQKNIMLAAKLLNAGHLGIPEHIRAKHEPLSQKEMALIKKHPFKAVEVINAIGCLKPIVPIILYHHEQYDGSGYPHGLKGEEIPLTVRIISLVMAFVAMISERPYRRPKAFEETMREITSLAGTQFDPKVVDALWQVLKKKEIINVLIKCEIEIGEMPYGTQKRKTGDPY